MDTDGFIEDKAERECEKITYTLVAKYDDQVVAKVTSHSIDIVVGESDNVETKAIEQVQQIVQDNYYEGLYETDYDEVAKDERILAD